MEILKKNMKLVLLFIMTILVVNIFLSLIYYIFGFDKNIYNIILFISYLLIIYFFNLKIGKNKKKETIQNSFMFSMLVISIMFILNIIISIENFGLQSILYYIIILVTSTLGILIGRRKRTQD